MAGTGEIHTLRRLRVLHGQVAEGVPFGTHLSTHIAIGLLFLGGGRYTLSNSPAATAALLCAFWPTMPATSGDNRAHLQAARHLWVLATEPRYLVARDVDTDSIVVCPVKIQMKEGYEERISPPTGPEDSPVQPLQTISPLLLPDVDTIASISLDTPRYWPVTLPLESSQRHYSALLHNHSLFVKRRKGHLSYMVDPRGTKSLFSRPGADSGSIVFDTGRSGEMVEPMYAAKNSRDPMIGFLAEQDAIPCTRHLARRNFGTDPLDSADSQFAAFSRIILVECLSQDKSSIMPVYRSFYSTFIKARGSSTTGPEALAALAQLRFACSFYGPSFHRLIRGDGQDQSTARHRELLNPFFISSLAAQLRFGLSIDPSTEGKKALREYLRTRKWPDEATQVYNLAKRIMLVDAPDAQTIVNLRQAVTASGLPQGAAELVLTRALHSMWSGHRFCWPDTAFVTELADVK